MNSYCSSSQVDDTNIRQLCSKTSISMQPQPAKTERKIYHKPNLKRPKSAKDPSFWTQRVIPANDQNQPPEPTTVKSLRFATSNKIHEYFKRQSQLPKQTKQKVNCIKCCSLI